MFLFIELAKFYFTVVHIVTDNLSVNSRMLKLLNKEKGLNHKVKHPVDGHPNILLSFDPCHVLKNIWTKFVDRKRVNSYLSFK